MGGPYTNKEGIQIGGPLCTIPRELQKDWGKFAKCIKHWHMGIEMHCFFIYLHNFFLSHTILFKILKISLFSNDVFISEIYF